MMKSVSRVGQATLKARAEFLKECNQVNLAGTQAAAFEHVPTTIIDADGIIVTINKVGKKLLRVVRSADIVGRPALNLFHPDYRGALREWIGACIQIPGSAPAHEAVMIALDGTQIPVEIRAVSHLVNERIQILVTYHNISDRDYFERRLREEQNFSDAALNGLPGIFYHCAEDGRLLRWNKNLERLSGYSAQELAGMSVLDFFVDEEKTRIASWIAEVYEKGKSEAEADLLTKNGRCIPYIFTANLFEKDGQRGYIGVALDISDRKAIEQKLQEEHDFSSALLDSLPGIFYRYDENQCLIRWNKNHELVTGYSAEELATMHPLDFFLEEERELIASQIGKIFVDGQSNTEANFLLKDGRIVPYLFTGVNLTYGDKSNFVGIGIDITERKQAENSLREKTALLEAQIESSADGILIVDRRGRKLVQNRRLNELWKIPHAIAENSDSACQFNFFATQTTNAADFIAKVQWLDEHYDEISRNEIELLDGTFLDRYSAPVLDQDGHNYGRIWVFSDITESKQAQSRIHHLAHYDPLTQLANRHTFHLQLEEGFSNRRDKLGLLFIDLDGFKLINDTKGHRVGDTLLKQVADRLRVACQEPGMLIARLGGDEFAGLIPDTNTECATKLAHSLVETLSMPYYLNGDIQLQIGASVGIALAPEHGDGAEMLLLRADTALYAAKATGKGTVRMFSFDMESRIQQKLHLEVNLRAALENQEGLFVFYQPIVEIETGRVTAREALVRWYLPGRGWISPGEFIPIAEQSSLIDKLGVFVLNRACYDATRWKDEVRVAVNISASQLGKGTLAQIIQSALIESGLPPNRLEIEVTETALLGDEQVTVGDLREVKSLGVRVALDDFGTGYSSLAHLRIFPFDKIKIDGSFVKDAINQPECAAVVRAVADLGRRLGVTTVAEGVETSAHLDCIRNEGCSEFQGYLYGRPIPREEDTLIVAALNAGMVKTIAA